MPERYRMLARARKFYSISIINRSSYTICANIRYESSIKMKIEIIINFRIEKTCIVCNSFRCTRTKGTLTHTVHRFECNGPSQVSKCIQYWLQIGIHRFALHFRSIISKLETFICFILSSQSLYSWTTIELPIPNVLCVVCFGFYRSRSHCRLQHHPISDTSEFRILNDWHLLWHCVATILLCVSEWILSFVFCCIRNVERTWPCNSEEEIEWRNKKGGEQNSVVPYWLHNLIGIVRATVWWWSSNRRALNGCMFFDWDISKLI